MEGIQVMGVRGLPLIHAGDDIAALICKNAMFEDGDILCVASTIWSKAKGNTKKLAEIIPSERAKRLGHVGTALTREVHDAANVLLKKWKALQRETRK